MERLNGGLGRGPALARKAGAFGASGAFLAVSVYARGLEEGLRGTRTDENGARAVR